MKKHQWGMLLGALFIGVLPTVALLVFALVQEPCWADTPLSSRTYGIVMAVDWFIALAIVLPVFLHHMSGIYGSQISLHWLWLNPLTLLFDIGWLAAGSYQIGNYGVELHCGLAVACIALLCVKLLWTLGYSCVMFIS